MEFVPIVDTEGGVETVATKDDIGGHAALQAGLPERRVRSETLSRCHRTDAFGIQHGYVPKEILWGECGGPHTP
jgi:hypothetical protein